MNVERIQRELALLRQGGQECALFADAPRPAVLYRQLPTGGRPMGLPDFVDVVVPVPSGHPAPPIDLAGLDVGGLFAGTGLAAKGFSREELEKAAIREVVAEKHLWGIDHREDEFSAFCYELKEAVRHGKSGTELAEQIGRSALLELIVAANSATTESEIIQDIAEHFA